MPSFVCAATNFDHSENASENAKHQQKCIEGDYFVRKKNVNFGNNYFFFNFDFWTSQHS